MPIWVSKGKETPYEQDHRRLELATDREFWAYYLRRRGVDDALLSKLSDGLRVLVSESLATELLTELRKGFQKKDLLGQIGEIISSYVMEEQEGVLLCPVNWPAQPFSVVRDLDLAGLCTESWLSVVVEIKATASTDLSAQAHHLTDDLHDGRVRSKLDLSLDTGRSRRSIVARFRRALEEGRFQDREVTADDITKVITAHEYVRVGILIHPRRLKGNYDYQPYLRRLRTDDLDNHSHSGTSPSEEKELPKLPTVFLDIDIGDMDAALNDWMRLEAIKERRV